MKDILLKTYPHGTIVARYKLGGINRDAAVCNILMIRKRKFLGIFKYNNEVELNPRGLANTISLENIEHWRDTDYVRFAREVENNVYQLEREQNVRLNRQDKFLNKFT